MEDFNKMLWTPAVEPVQRTIEWAASRNVAPRICTGPKGPSNQNGGARDSEAPIHDSNEAHAAQRSIEIRDAAISKKKAHKKAKKKAKKAADKQDEITDGFTRVGRQEYRELHGRDSVVTGADNTCLPDALTSACAALGYRLCDALSIMPTDGSDPSIAAADKLLHAHGFMLEYCGDIQRMVGGPELNVLRMMSGVYIIDVQIHTQDGIDDHCFCFDAARRALIDNSRWAKVLQADDSDLASSTSARMVFMDWFPGARAVRVRSAYALRVLPCAGP